MIKKINIFLVLLLLLLSIGVVSATADADNGVMSNNGTISDSVTSDSDEILSSDVTDDELVTASSHVITSSNYNTYFNSKGQLISSAVKEGDTLEFDGSFKDKEVTFDMALNIVGTSTNDMKNFVFTFSKGASGSTVSNLKITNTNDYKYGIFLNNASNCVIRDCLINNTGASSYTVCVANGAMYNNVSNNVLNTYGQTYGHGTRSTPAILLSGSHYNYIGDNVISCDDANAIYLSNFEGGPIKGGLSNFNTIHNNMITYNVLPTSWAYGIQVMGGNNTISSNRIYGAYRGISTSAPGNVIVDNWIINLTGADYNNPGIPSGGEIAIVGSYHSTIKNNHIVNARAISTGSGISVLDNSTVENNFVEVSLQGKGIYPQGSNIRIKDNTIITDSGSGILYNTYAYNLEVLDNNISSKSGVGVLVQKVSNKRMPGNITIVGNTIATGNKYAIDAAEANSSSVNVIGPNNIKKGCEVRTPEGSYDPSKPVYNFNGTVHNINPSNYGDYINDNGGLSSDIKDGDILNFTGEFYNKVIFINSAVKITGDNPTFYNTTFRVRCDGVWIENLVIRNRNASRLNAWGILVYKVAGATVTNCDIEVYDPNAAYAIYVVEASDVDVIGNKLFSSGDYLTYTLLAYAVEDCKFINNTISTLGTGVIHKFENQHCLDGDTSCLDGDTNCLDGDTNCLDGDTNCLDGDTNCLDGDTSCLDGDTNCLDGNSIGDGNHVLSEVYRTYGILMAYSSDNIVSGNIVNATSKLTERVSTYNSTNSIVGIDAYFNCQNNLFSDNEIYIKANDNYLYGMGVLGYTTGHTAPEGQGAINNQFISNYIVIDGTYYTDGIIIGSESHDTIIENNIIDLKSDVSYGITLEMSQKSTIEDNYLTLNSDVIYGVQAFSSNNNALSNNELDLNGKQVYGILFSNSNQNSVISNKIKAKGTGEKIDFHNFDSISAGNAGVFLKSNSTNNEIKKNDISSAKGYAVLVDEEAINNVIVENCLDSEKGIGDKAVSNNKSNVVENNYRYTFTGRLPMAKADYLDTAELSLIIDDGALVKFYIGDNEVGSATSSNGVATLDYKIEGSTVHSTYSIKAVASKENYLTKEFTSTLRVNKANLNVELDDVAAKILSKATFTATVTDASGKPVSGINVKFYRNQNRDIYIGEATTDSNGVAKLVSEIPSISGDSFTISANVTADSKFNAAGGKATLSILSDKSLQIELKDINVVYNDGKDLVATLKDNNGKTVEGIGVIVQLNGVNSTSTSDKDGKVVISLAGLTPDTYTAKVIFTGNKIYTAASVSAKVTVDKIETKLTAKYDANSKNIVVVVKDANGNPVKGLKVGFALDGVKYVTTDAKGTAIYSTKGLADKPYTVSVMAFGNEIYNDSNKETVKFGDKKQSKIFLRNALYFVTQTKMVQVTLWDGNNQPLANKTVAIRAYDSVWRAVTDENGDAFVRVGIGFGVHDATVSFDGDDQYNSSTRAGYIRVIKQTPSVMVRGADTMFKASDNNKIVKVHLRDRYDKALPAGSKIVIKLNGKTYVGTTDINGVASIKISINTVGTFTAQAMYGGNTAYNAVTRDVKIRIV